MSIVIPQLTLDPLDAVILNGILHVIVCIQYVRVLYIDF